MARTDLPRIGIALGDPAGIGPEIALKAALDPRVRALCRPLLFGDPGALAAQAKSCGIAARIDAFRAAAEARWRDGGVALVALEQFRNAPLEIGKVSAAHGRAATEAARAAIEAALAGDVEAVIAAPQTERSIKLAGIEFDGYPSFVARCTGVAPEDAFLMVCFGAMRIVHATLHVRLKRAIELITPERVARVVRTTDATLKRIGIAAPRIGVSGLNPHAGEDGMFGDEERLVIGPVLEALRREGLAVEGPFGADTLFNREGYDAFVVMFHDQGHIAAKTLAPNRTAGLTIGTPVLFSSVAHGSALDIAGTNRASPAAIIEAVERLVGAHAVNSPNRNNKGG